MGSHHHLEHLSVSDELTFSGTQKLGLQQEREQLLSRLLRLLLTHCCR